MIKKKKTHKNGDVENFLNMMIGIYEKLKATIILNDERLKAFPLTSEKRQRCSLALMLCNNNNYLRKINKTFKLKKKLNHIYSQMT